MKFVQTVEELEELVEYYLQQDAFVFDVETVGEHRGDPRRNRVTWMALATKGRADVIPMGHPHGELVRWEYPLKPSAHARLEKGLPLRASDYSADQRKATAVWTEAPEQLSPGQVFRGLEPLMFSDITKVGQNIKFDLETVAKYYGGRVPTPKYFDTMVAAYLINSSHRPGKAPYNRPYALNTLLHRDLGVEMIKGVGKQIEIHAFSVARKYTVLDGKWTWLLHLEYQKQLREKNLHRLMDLEMDVLEVLTSMELAGAPLDMEELKRLDPELQDMLVEIRGRAYQAAGKEFNLRASQQVAELLFSPKADGGQGLRPKKLTPGAKVKDREDPRFKPDIKDYSVDKEALGLLAPNKLVDILLEHSEVQRLHSTYIQSYLKDAPELGGKIHADFNQIGAETGRFSCREPNLQNVPNGRTALGKKVRGLFVANAPNESGNVLVVADYSQIEPRVLADLSGDKGLIEGYVSGSGDVYTELASPLGLPRDAGKVGFLSMSYGVQAEKASHTLGLSVRETQKILDKWEKQFKAVYDYKRQVIMDAKRRRPAHVVTLLGRTRYLPELFSDNYGYKTKAERQAFNTVIQGSAADIIKLAMVRLHTMLGNDLPDARILLQVHDELVVKCPAQYAEQCVEIMREAMEGITLLKKVPLVAGINVVDRWSEAK